MGSLPLVCPKRDSRGSLNLVVYSDDSGNPFNSEQFIRITKFRRKSPGFREVLQNQQIAFVDDLFPVHPDGGKIDFHIQVLARNLILSLFKRLKGLFGLIN